ncbi:MULTISPECIES: histidine phosphatase family protein [Burkholderia]|uniref:histidine phosphatase family protein n=1 Tax=Burkholderia TaxID=32008 RepID=UPI000530BDE0|nr:MULTISPECIES: histidine phosphatase family protein [Burkholderia]AOJ72817.1 histidine phosphatase super family protein [Burkholderia savannae]KGS04162.1 histidine phosphatase super family protein [Burkholderia sp. ABCPW 111]KVG44953.1 histidine phosphatase super family protein [Burkholderia sp. MSMB0265]KVG89941.1 histidine phosphatase super family protein [Burkholderia sp. MSMB2040]KVG96078.1 histidine phosphatase super family protein [Burkholderia sp. MSMB2041]
MHDRYRLILIRHGQTPDTLDGRFCGARDPALTALGHRMAIEASRHPALRGIAVVVTSPSLRARQTARHIADANSVSILVDERLRELSFGAWEGRVPDDVRDEPAYRRWIDDPAIHAPPGGETGFAVLARVMSAVRDAIGMFDDVALVTHKSPIRLLASFYGATPLSRFRQIADIHACSVSLIVRDGGGVALGPLGDTSHLSLAWRTDPDRARAPPDGAGALIDDGARDAPPLIGGRDG